MTGMSRWCLYARHKYGYVECSTGVGGDACLMKRGPQKEAREECLDGKDLPAKMNGDAAIASADDAPGNGLGINADGDGPRY